jgi:hypothetical protein
MLNLSKKNINYQYQLRMFDTCFQTGIFFFKTMIIIVFNTITLLVDYIKNKLYFFK